MSIDEYIEKRVETCRRNMASAEKAMMRDLEYVQVREFWRGQLSAYLDIKKRLRADG